MGKKTKLTALAATAGAALSVALAAPAMAYPGGGPNGTIFMGVYPSYSACVQGAQANYAIHGPFYICQYVAPNLYYLYMH